MNYRQMSLKEGWKYLGFWWYALIEVLLLCWALSSVAQGKYLETIAIFILIELREMNCKMKGV